jgi:1-acyl-sn-glycerol-3-phosphate acyltransferase
MSRWLRILRLALHTARGLFIAAFFFPFQRASQRRREIRRWSARLLAILAVRLEVQGAMSSARPLMLVGNHVSWVDIFAIDAVLPVRFVAKSEVRSWPFVGWLSARCGTLFVDQARRRDTTRINDLVTAALRAGEVFAVFPEGTTSDGSTLLKFHASLLEPALQASAVVQPFAIRYERPDGSLCTEAAFDGARSIWDTVIGITSFEAITARVRFLEPVASTGRHRRDIAGEARDAISRTLYLPDSSNRTAQAPDLRVAAH